MTLINPHFAAVFIPLSDVDKTPDLPKNARSEEALRYSGIADPGQIIRGMSREAEDQFVRTSLEKGARPEILADSDLVELSDEAYTQRLKDMKRETESAS